MIIIYYCKSCFRCFTGADPYICSGSYSATADHCVRDKVCEELPRGEYWAGEVPR